MLGRWQPWHKGHQALFEEAIKRTGQVIIMVRDMPISENNPLTFLQVQDRINDALKEFKDKYDVIKVPNITNICYGRDVGYKIEEIELPEHIKKISATQIRKSLNE